MKSATLETKCDTSIEENGGSARKLFICEYNLTQKKVKIGHAFTVPEHSFQLFIPMFSRWLIPYVGGKFSTITMLICGSPPSRNPGSATDLYITIIQLILVHKMGHGVISKEEYAEVISLSYSHISLATVTIHTLKYL